MYIFVNHCTLVLCEYVDMNKYTRLNVKKNV